MLWLLACTAAVPGSPVVDTGGGSETDFVVLDDGTLIAVERDEAGSDAGEWLIYNYSSPVDGPDRPWREAQGEETWIYRMMLSLL